MYTNWVEFGQFVIGVMSGYCCIEICKWCYRGILTYLEIEPKRRT